MTLKRSRGASFDSARVSARLASSIDGPPMEPEVSMMKIVSFGSADFSGDCGGITISSPYVSLPLSVKSALLGSLPRSGCQTSSKS